MWTDVLAWFQSPGGARVLQTAVVPALAILVAGVIAALIGRAAVRSAIARADRGQAVTAVAGLVESARATRADGSRGDRRRVVRLRTDADVRLRLLPLHGAALAADWAAAQLGEQAPGGDEAVDEVRDRLVAWVQHPRRARRLFSRPAATRSPTPEATEGRRGRSGEEPASGGDDEQRDGTGRSAREDEVSGAAADEPVTSTDGPGRSAPPVEAPAGGVEEAVPAWRRTRSGERLQQERASAHPAVPAAEESRDPSSEDDADVRTSPVGLQHPHRASTPALGGGDGGPRREAHQPTRSAHAATTDRAEAPGQQPEQEATRPEPAERRTPAWLDVYDDDAHVTRQDLDLRTPPPVAATSVRDRSASGDDIVPRT